jgi:predicted  nucleic acid-binding Zn-ribbon protein
MEISSLTDDLQESKTDLTTLQSSNTDLQASLEKKDTVMKASRESMQGTIKIMRDEINELDAKVENYES